MTIKALTTVLTASLLALSLTACNRDNAGAGSSAKQDRSSPGSAASGSSSSPTSPSSPSSPRSGSASGSK